MAGRWAEASEDLARRGVGDVDSYTPEEMLAFVSQYEALLGNQPAPPAKLVAALQASQLGDQPIMNELKKVVVRAQIPDECAGPWRVSLSEPPRASSAGGAPIVAGLDTSVEMVGVFVEVTWGVAGARSTIEIDYRQGQSYTFYGSFLEVAIRVPDVQVFRLGAHATYGETGPQQAPAIRSVDYGSPLAAANLTLPIPRYAVRWTHTIDEASTQPREIRMQRTPAGAVTLARQDFAAAGGDRGSPADWFPIPPGATMANFSNTSAATLNNVRLYYQLGI